ncbi:MAG: DUF1800 family protein [Polaribacter sp.]
MPYLDPYSGNWSAKKARHLLKRTSFGITQKLTDESVSLGLNDTINKLFEVKPLPETPLKHEYDGVIADPEVNYGQTWVPAHPYPKVNTQQQRNKIFRSRNQSLYAWSFLQMMDSGISIREKLTLFWHNHFVAENENPHREFHYMNTIRKNALGNFKEITKQITIDPNMLIFLSGNLNTDEAPNENYARELLELFTIGKGNAVSNGDYTNYTEDDVVQMAKVLTGWKARWIQYEDPTHAYFGNWLHAKGDKTLSHRFDNAVISENGENEYIDLIEKIFEKDECSRFITRKFYKWFVNSEITDEIETNIIEPLAKIIRDDDYDFVPALKVLLSSDHFFESTFCMIKSPIDLMLSATKSLLVGAPTSSVKSQYDFALVLYLACTDLNQSIFHHPDVAGWKAYYQAPLFYKSWVNTFLLPKRLDYCRILVTGGDLIIDDDKYTVPPMVPVLQIAAQITNATDPNILVQELVNQLFNYEITDDQTTSLKNILIPGLPDFEWTVEYGEYLADPNNNAKAIAVDSKLRNLIAVMVQMSEFQIM